MNNDLISRENLKKAIENAYKEYDGYDPHDLSRFAERVDEIIGLAPTVNPCKDCDLYFKAMTKEEMQKGGAV